MIRHKFYRLVRDCQRRLFATTAHQTERAEFQVLIEHLEPRNMLSAVFPAYVNGDFAFGDPQLDAPYGLENTFLLSSNPTATKTIYLDYTGHHSVDNSWGHDIMFPSFDRDGDTGSFSDAELIEIQKNFQSVAEDYAPFDVNVTTIEPLVEDLINEGGSDIRWGIRALQTQATDGFGNGIGGVAFIGSFSWDEDAPAFSFNKGVVNGSMTISHEVGHTVTLGHDGLGGQTYHPGTGTGTSPTDWGPIMGATFGRNLVQWSNGDYQNSTNTQDDFERISTQNGFGLVEDDHGNDINSATPLTVENDTEVSAWGFVDLDIDKDVFSFATGTGVVEFDIQPFGENPNLDVEVSLLDESGNIVQVFNPIDDVDATISVNLIGGNYYLWLDGVGREGVYSDYGSVGFYTIIGTVQPEDLTVDVVLGETGQAEINNQWKTIEFVNQYNNPIVVVGPAGIADADPATVRVRNVSQNSFQVRIQEWTYQDGVHGTEQIGYIVLEEGVHRLDDGSMIIASSSNVTHTSSDVFFDLPFDNQPVVLTQTVTVNGGAPVVTRANNVNTHNFQLKLQEEEGADGRHNSESVNWIAMTPSTGGTLGELGFEVVRTDEIVDDELSNHLFAQSFGSTPVLVGSVQTDIGNNPISLRVDALNDQGFAMMVQEEQSDDDETEHGGESVGYIAIASGTIIERINIGETGVINGLDRDWRTVNLASDFLDPVVIVSPPGLNEADPTTIRVRNVTSDSFEVRVEEWNYLDRDHAPESVSYMVFESGTHVFTDGTQVVARNTPVNHNGTDVFFFEDTLTDPVIFGQVTTTIGRSTVTHRIDDVGSKGFFAKLQEEEAADGRHSFETLSWIAIETTTFGEVGGLAYEVIDYDDGVNHLSESIVFNNSYRDVPLVFSDMQTTNGIDPAVVRHETVTTNHVSLFVEEEQSATDEVGHLDERIGVFAIERGLIAGFTTNVSNDGPVGTAPPVSFRANMSSLPRVTFINNWKSPWAETALPFAEARSAVHDDNTAINTIKGSYLFTNLTLVANTKLDHFESKVDAENQISVMTPRMPETPTIKLVIKQATEKSKVNYGLAETGFDLEIEEFFLDELANHSEFEF